MEELFSTDFVVRYSCGAWRTAYVWTYVISNLIIFAAYVAIAGILVFTRPSSGDLEKLSPKEGRAIGIVYGSFILLCGLGHFADGVLTFQLPMYHLLAVYHSVTALVSVVAAGFTLRYRARILVGM